MMKKKIILLVIVAFTGATTQAQDFHLSQYDAAPLALNPGMTGLHNGFYRLHAHYRTQWSSIATKPFTTAALSIDKPAGNFAWGAQLMNNRAGASNFNVMSLLLSGAYDWAIDKNRKHHISFGLQGGVIQKSVNVSNLTWDSQYVFDNGGSFNTNLSSNENFTNQSIFLPEVNVGAMYFFGNEASILNPFIGFSAQHLLQPNESFFGRTNKLPIRYITMAGTKINLVEKFQLLPKFFKMDQINDNEMTFSLIGHYFMRSADTYLIFGPTFRISGPVLAKKNFTVDAIERDAAVVELGIKYSKFTARVSYDVNTSSLQPATNGRGGLEISLTYLPIKLKPNPVPTCPRL